MPRQLPLSPGYRSILQDPAGQQTETLAPTSQATVRSGCSGCPVLTRTTRHLQACALVSPPRSHKRTEAETGLELSHSHKHLPAALVLDSSSSAKDSGCCRPESKEAVFPSTHGHPSPHRGKGQEKHAHSMHLATPKGSTPSHFIHPELPGLLGIFLCLNTYIYIYV